MRKLHIIVEIPKNNFIESFVTQAKHGSKWHDRETVKDFEKRMLEASVTGEDLRILDFEHCIQCMRKTLSGNSLKELVDASMTVEDFFESRRHGQEAQELRS